MSELEKYLSNQEVEFINKFISFSMISSILPSSEGEMKNGANSCYTIIAFDKYYYDKHKCNLKYTYENNSGSHQFLFRDGQISTQ